MLNTRHSSSGEDGASDDAGQSILGVEGSFASEAGEVVEVVCEVPREVTGLADVPECEQTADLAGVLCEIAQWIAGQHGERRGYGGVEEVVYRLVVDSASARSWLMWAFMPASANWMRSMPVR
jgi:hypothetical protein